MSDGSNPARRWAAITPSDSTNLSPACRSIYVTGAGALVLVGDDGNPETFEVEAKTVYPFAAKRVNATGTTATGLKALY